ncbi:MAG: prolipoprotein diacylglyceryl transferase [Akkermansiaceae bacterium]
MLATYVHNINPVIFSINDALKLRWYGLAYLLAFVVGFLLLKRLGDKKLWVLPGDKASDFITLAAVFGVFLGGRIGNIIFYQWDEFVANPSVIFKVWEGGMASHGGILGLMIFTLVYSYKKKVSWTGLGDGLCVVAPLGVMFGRIANFINGELYGRIDKTFAWSMKFPKTLFDSTAPEFENQFQANQIAANADPNYATYLEKVQQLSDNIRVYGYQPGSAQYNEWLSLANQESTRLNAVIRDHEPVRQAIGELLEPRYPSQLFQAAGEGLGLFLILFITRMCFRKLPHGILTGMFFFFYAVFRITMENFRQQETEDVTFLGTTFTMGQFLSLFMIVIGLGFIIQAIMRPRYLDAIDADNT